MPLTMEKIDGQWPGPAWENTDDCENWVLYCGWPKEAAKAVVQAKDFCFTMKCLDMARTGSKSFQQFLPCAFWVNIPLCFCVVCSQCCSWSVGVRNLEGMTETSFCGQAIANTATGVFCLNACYYAAVRTEFRKKYDLAGSPCEDFFCFCCFGPCILCTDANELQFQTNKKIPFAQYSGGIAGVKVTPA